MKKNSTFWRELQSNLCLPTQAFIDGAYVSASDGSTYSCINPANGVIMAAVAACTAADVDLAVRAAKRTYEQGKWSRLAPSARKKVMKKLSALILENCEELALLESMNVGKPVQDAMEIDVPGAAACFEWYAESIDKIYGEVAPTDGNNIAEG